MSLWVLNKNLRQQVDNPQIYFKLSEIPSQFSSNTTFDDDNNSTNSSLKCSETLEIPPGCWIVDRQCQCWKTATEACRDSSVKKWDFKSYEICFKILI